jgi:sugar phosphate isomerase/epimerase
MCHEEEKLMSAIKVGICEWAVPSRRMDRFLVCKEMGYQGMVVDLGWYDKPDSLRNKDMRETYKELSQVHQIEMTTLSVNNLYYQGMSHASSYEEMVHTFEAMMKVALDMKIGLLQIPSFGSGMITNKEEFENTAKCLQYLCQISEGSGVTIGWESSTNGADSLRMLEKINKPHLKLYFDTANPLWLCGGLDGPATLDTIKDHVVEIHMKEVTYNEESKGFNYVALGEGQVKLMESIDIIKSMNYSGWVHNENELSYEILKKDAALLKTVFQA